MADNNEEILEQLQTLIEQTYRVEEEYKTLRSSYDHLQDTIENLIEFLPNALWVLFENGEVFTQNSNASKLAQLLEIMDFTRSDYELNFEEGSYLIKTSSYKDKILISATDITEQKRKENLATMGQMAAHLSHEIRNPIGSISLLTSTLMKRVKLENKPIVLEIQKSVYRIERIIKATLMFSKGVKEMKSPLSWNQIKEDIELSIGYYSYTKEIRFELPEQDFDINGDADLLSMLFSNFVFNAIDAIEADENEEGLVKIKYENDEKFHIFKVYDSGVCIEDKLALFEAFKSTKEKGNGLGLVLSQQIAHAHEGDVRLLEGDVKCFEIRLGK
ncbi:GHKL domain-containing protein [Sulfurimonas sp. MAG313]|nr:ATP-binding protein [Sulfurimonas sp. MAG313]MDF1881228.1 GHKL domain-containing protein [Sulfurimonas sp. MAG313]